MVWFVLVWVGWVVWARWVELLGLLGWVGLHWVWCGGFESVCVWCLDCVVLLGGDGWVVLDCLGLVWVGLVWLGCVLGFGVGVVGFCGVG